MSVTFSEMGLAAPLLQALEQLNIVSPTPVQANIVPRAMAGGDYMVSSQTGSGKTFGFLLPVMHRMMQEPVSLTERPYNPDTLVLCPTRELAQQVSQDAINLVRCFKGMRVATVVGGMPYGKQMAGLRGARLVVGTPGRLLDLADQGKLDLSDVSTLIVDEADRMLDLGFADDLKALSDMCGSRSQTLMFSATFAPRVTGLATAIMNKPERVELAPSNETNADIAQTLHWADSYGHKRKLLNHWLNDASIDQAVVFTSTQGDAETLARELGDDGLIACALHGGMPQVVRNRRLAGVRRGDIKILVATDVAARGLDVPAITHVFNFGMPMKAEDYVHRIGRTGRAGRSGVAVTIAQADDRIKLRAIERYINAQIPIGIIEGLEPRMPMKESGGSAGRGGRSGGGGFGGGRGGDRSSSGGRGKPSGGFGGSREGGSREGRSFGDRAPSEGRSFAPRGEGRPFGDRAPSEGRSFAPRGEGRPFGDRAPSEGRSFAPRGEGRPEGGRPFGDRAPSEGRFADRRPREGGFGDKPRTFGDRAPSEGRFADRRPKEGGFGDKPRSFEGRPFEARKPADAKFGDRRTASTGAPRKPEGAGEPAKRGPLRPGAQGDYARGGFSRKRAA
jgi:superfamily II DNA/RNA helicase